VPETLWAPWRIDYILSDQKPSGCVLCLPEDHTGPLPERLVLASDRLVFLIMNRYPYNNGHVLVAPRRHVATLSLTTSEERAALMDLTAKATEAIGDLMKPDGFNIGVNQGRIAGAGIAEHLHIHVTPRWEGDTSYMTTVSETRVIPEHIRLTYERLLGAFA
jgi:ATP adenylyltransferase